MTSFFEQQKTKPFKDNFGQFRTKSAQSAPQLVSNLPKSNPIQTHSRILGFMVSWVHGFLRSWSFLSKQSQLNLGGLGALCGKKQNEPKISAICEICGFNIFQNMIYRKTL